jgi:cytochrome P450
MKKNDFDIVNPSFLYHMDEHAECLFETEPRGFYWHPVYKHWIVFSMDRLKEASKMNETFSLATTSPAPFDPTPLGGVWRAGYALTLREGAHHHLAKKHSLDWAKRRAPDYTKFFKDNLKKYFDSIEPGEPFKAYDIIGRVVTDTQIQMIEFPWSELDVTEDHVKHGFHEWMRPGNVFSNFNPDFDYDKPVAESTEFYAMFSRIVHEALDYYELEGRDMDTMINMTYTLSDKQWEYNDKPKMMGYMFIQSLWTVVIPTFALSLYQYLAMCLAHYPEITKRIRADRTLVKKFSREVLRLAPLKGGIRDVPETVDYHGYKIDFGSRILLYTYGANRDPKYFKDPLEFRLERDDEPNPVTLAYGPHHCTGDFIVRNFLDILTNELLDRFESFEITNEPERLPAMFGSTTVWKDLEMKMS